MEEFTELSECPEKVKKLICVQYPGQVVNIDNMLKTLGGVETISEVYKDGNRRLELRFRPDDINCRPTCGESHHTTGLVVKITRKKKKQQFLKPNDKTIIKSFLVGIVQTKYVFENLCDFQYLPIVRKPNSDKYECINELIPRSIVSCDWLNKECPLFLPPAVFTRMDIPQDYYFRNDLKGETNQEIPGTLYKTRQKRKHYAIFCNFNDKDIPKEPRSEALEQIRCRLLDEKLYEKLIEIFKERPMWSKNALKGKYGFNREKLTLVLPCIAYYFKAGPWGKLWTRLGYDPKKDHNSWIYQSFDFRLRQVGGARSQVKAKRRTMDYLLPYKNVNFSKRKAYLAQPLNTSEHTDNKKVQEDPDRLYIFREDIIPLHRQIFYQYCDIDVPEIQKILQDSILSLNTPICSEKTGWLPSGIDAKCRNIISKMLEKKLLEKHIDSSTFEDSQSNEESEEMDE